MTLTFAFDAGREVTLRDVEISVRYALKHDYAQFKTIRKVSVRRNGERILLTFNVSPSADMNRDRVLAELREYFTPVRGEFLANEGYRLDFADVMTAHHV